MLVSAISLLYNKGKTDTLDIIDIVSASVLFYLGTCYQIFVTNISIFCASRSIILLLQAFSYAFAM